MIAWMQKHNKYLVITIWIATIAFIGAGFVGWGSYHYGSKASAIARVGDIDITQEKFNFAYQSLYRQYAKEFGSNFDEAKAKEMGLSKQVLNQLVAQGVLLNLAKEYGVIVSDDELALALSTNKSFWDKGHFSKEAYRAFLEATGLKAKTFETLLRDDLTIQKLMSLLNAKAVNFEKEVIGFSLGISDKVAYEVLTPADINVTVDDKRLKEVWEAQKDNYKTPAKYKLSLLWSDTSDINITEDELKSFYRKNSFNYIGEDGKELSFDKAKVKVEQDYRVKKGKKRALLDYIAFKKGKKGASEQKELALGDRLLPKELWDKIESSDSGKILKPKPINGKYVTVKVDGIIPPQTMSFKEAKPLIMKGLLEQERQKALIKRAQELLKEPKALKNESPWLSLGKSETLKDLNIFNSIKFIQKLFTSNKKEGIIKIDDKVVIYRIVKQKVDNQKITKEIEATANRIKQNEFESSLLKELYSKYTLKMFVKGL